jgi:death-on-curing protein
LAGTLQTLDFDDIVEINRRMILEFGGEPISTGENTVNPSSLHFALGTLQGDLFGTPLFPSLAAKAASLAWHIIAGHVFLDGNKRTGMEAARMFLDLNGMHLPIDEEIIEKGERIANGSLSLHEFVDWLSSRVHPNPNL